MSFDLIFTWLMVLLRANGIVLLLPTLGARPLPIPLRISFSLCFATLLYGIVPHASIAGMNNAGLILAAAGEVLLGLTMGFVGRLIFAGIEMAGRLIVNEIGLVAGPGFDAPSPEHEPLPSFISMFAGMCFFLSGAHLGVFRAFVRSFYLAPAGAPSFSHGAAETLVQLSENSIELGVRIAAPFIALNFLTNLAFSILGRAVPRMGVFVISYSARVLLGMALLAGSGALFTRYFGMEFDALPLRLLHLLPAP